MHLIKVIILIFGFVGLESLWAFEGHFELTREQGSAGEYYVTCPSNLEINVQYEPGGDRIFLELSAPERSPFAYFGKEIRVGVRDPEKRFFGYIRSGGVVRTNYASNIDSLTVLAKALYGFPLRYTEGKKIRVFDDGEWVRFSQHRRAYGVFGLGFEYHCDYQRVRDI